MATVRLNRLAAETGGLHGVCLCCGDQAASYVPHKFKFDPVWLMFMPPIVRVMYAWHHVRIAVPLCHRHRNRLKLPAWGAYFLLATVIPSLGVIVLLNTLEWGSLAGLLTLLLVLYAIGLVFALVVVRLMAPRMVQFDHVSVKLVNVAASFAHAHTDTGLWQPQAYGQPVMAQLAEPSIGNAGQSSFPQAAYSTASMQPTSAYAPAAYGAAKQPAPASSDSKVLLLLVGGLGSVTVVAVGLMIAVGMALSKAQARKPQRPVAAPQFVAAPPPRFVPPAMPTPEPFHNPPPSAPWHPEPPASPPVPTFAPPVFSPREAEAELPRAPGEVVASAPAVDPFVEISPAPPPMPVTRIWSDASGNFRVEAKLLDQADGNVRLERADGKVITVPLERLSPADQEFVKGRP